MHSHQGTATRSLRTCRVLAWLAMLLPVIGLRASAQECAAPVERCAPPLRPSTAAPRAPTSAAPRAAPVAAAPVMFAAPPMGGQITGESNSVGIRGLELHFPEWRIALPTLQMPSLVRYRRNPEMVLDGGRAPMVAGPAAAYGQIPLPAAPAPASPKAAEPAAPRAPTSAAPRCAPAYDSRDVAPPVPELGASDETYQELEQTRQQLAEVRQQLDRLMQATAALEQVQAAGARRPAAGPVRVQSDEIDPVPQDVNELPEPPPATTQRRTRGPSGTVVRSQSPVVPAGASNSVRPAAGDSRTARPSPPLAPAGTKKPVQRQGHAPYNPGSSSR